MTFAILPARDLPDSLAELWSRWQMADPALASPYFHPAFTQAVAGVRDDVWIAVLDDGAAFFPFQRGAFRIGVPVGGLISDYHGIIARPGFTYDPLELVQRCGLRAWDFDHLPVAQASFARWHVRQVASPMLDLAAGAPVGSAHMRDQARRKRRKLERELGTLEFAMHSSDGTTLAQLMTWKSAQYRRTGVPDLFVQPWAVEVLKRIHATQEGTDFCGVLSTLHAGGRLVAAHFGMRSRGVLHYWFPVYDAELSGYSPGFLLLADVIAAAPAHGITQIDFGKGDQRFKQQIANTFVPIAEGSVIASPALGAARRSRAALARWVRASPLRPVARWILRRGRRSSP
jgi:CelD/BcsL family acetyltransferase involved in cellulose biosynthesis